MSTSDERYFEEVSRETPGEKNFRVEIPARESEESRKPRLSSKRSAELGFDAEPEGQLTIDVYQTGNEIVVESAVAGVDPENLDINVTTDSITIRGHREREKEINEENYYYRECYWGRFSRSVILPQEVDPEGASVKFKNGILSVHLPKLNRAKAKKLQVKLD